MATPLDTLCDTYPEPYLQFTAFVLNLKFDEEPNYARYISLFRGIIGQNPYNWPVHTDVAQEDWIRKYWAKNYYITAVAGADGGRFLVVMPKADVGMKSIRQSSRVTSKFPFKLIKKKWAEGFHVTAMATAGSQWAVELDFQFPAEGIHERRKQGYYITSVAATLDEVAFIFGNIGGVPATESVEQETLQTINFPDDNMIEEKRARNYCIASLCYGRTVA
ncbi:hypothetical protein NL676_033879 [Syzygium grande]|nr:hypothetical protein NL676_033879 [Syzygium grande]